MNRRAFTLLLLATAAVLKLPKIAAAAPACRGCGDVLVPGRHAAAVKPALGPYLYDELCPQCLAASLSDADLHEPLTADQGEAILVRISGPNLEPDTRWVSIAAFNNRDRRSPYRMRRLRNEPASIADILDVATGHLRRPGARPAQ